MYKATAVGEYIFPFFSDEMRAFQNNFGDQGPLGSQVGSQAGAVMEGVSDTLNMGKAFANEYLAQGNLDTQGAAGSYVETPKFYNYTENENAVDVQFPLINTLLLHSFASIDLTERAQFLSNHQLCGRSQFLGTDLFGGLLVAFR